jgi:hypothetical protein
VFLPRIRDFGSCKELQAESFGAYLLFGVLIVSPKFRFKTPSGLGDPSIERLGLFSGLIFSDRGGGYYRPCPGSTDNLIFSCHRVFISSTDSGSVVLTVGSTDPVPKVPIT